MNRITKEKVFSVSKKKEEERKQKFVPWKSSKNEWINVKIRKINKKNKLYYK